MSSRARAVASDLTPKLSAAAAKVAERERSWREALRERDQLVVDAIDEGMQQRVVAGAAKISQTMVNSILAKSQPDAVLPR